MNQKKNYHHGDLRKQLLETALQIISEQGLEKVSMRGLGQRLGVSRTAPYRHFSDKNELLCALAEEGYRTFTKNINALNKKTSVPPLERLRHVGFSYLEFALANPVHYRLMFGHEILKNKRTPELVKLAEEAFSGTIYAIEMCQEAKLIRPINPYIIANALWSMSHGISTLINDGQIQAANAFKGLPALTQKNEVTGEPDVQQIFHHITDTLMNGFIEK